VALEWIQEKGLPVWDADKVRIVGGAPAGIFDTRYGELAEGDTVPGQWWRVAEDGATVGYGWLELVWGDAEILLATASEQRGRGVGAFTLARLEDEARARGLNYLTNIVRPTHPEAGRVQTWLTARGFKPGADGRLVKRVGA